MTPDNAAAVAQLCVRLNGLPLAIELAAGRVTLFSPQAMLSRLQHRLDWLSREVPDLTPRERTLRGAIGWSYTLLTADEQRLFRQLSPFVDGWSLEAAEAVCVLAGDTEVLKGVASLVDKGLVQRHSQEGEPRFTMLETIRAYACEKLLASEDNPAVYRRHLDYYLALAEEAEPALHGAEQITWLGRLDDEYGNLEAALHWALTHDVAKGARLAGAVMWYWFVRGHWSTGLRWLEMFVEREDEIPAAALIKVLGAAAWFRGLQGSYERSLALAEQALVVGRQGHDKRGMAFALMSRGAVPAMLGNLSESEALFVQASAWARESGEEHVVRIILTIRGITAIALGQYELAEQRLEKTLRLARESEDTYLCATALVRLAVIACEQQDYVRGTALSSQSAALFEGLGDKYGLAHALLVLGELARLQHQSQTAQTRFGESLTLNWAIGNQEGVALALRGLTAVASEQGLLERAARLWGAAEGIIETTRMRPVLLRIHDLDTIMSSVRARLGEVNFATIQAQGRAMPLDRVMAYALVPD